MATSFLSNLPTPKSTLLHPIINSIPLQSSSTTNLQVDQNNNTISKPTCTAPKYGFRKGFIPRGTMDYGDGGSYPECHVLQYPLNMGKKDKIAHGKVAALQVDETGIVQYDSIIKQEKNVTAEQLSRPTDDEAKITTDRTREALEKKMDGRIKSSVPKAVNVQSKAPVYIQYTPGQAQDNDEYNSGSKNRIIKLHEAAVDPLEPAKHRHKKLPAPAPDVLPPVMHSPPRKMTVQEAQSWKIPPCISNWKNVKGYTIPLDKRLAADGRGLTETTLNDAFAQMAESLAVAEYKAREELRERSQLRDSIARKQKEEKDIQLRDLAASAREKRFYTEEAPDDEAEDIPDAIESKDERDQLREERKREREREYRMEKTKKPKHNAPRDDDRDISEAVALGKQLPKSQDTLFDARLFNTTQGVSSGFGNEDDYTVYSKPFALGGASAPYRPTVTADSEMHVGAGDEMGSLLDTNKFKADRGFSGTDSTVASSKGGRARPVEFEKAPEDNFSQFMDTSVKKSSSIDVIGGSGHMKASSGSAPVDSYSSNNRSIDFSKGKSLGK